MAVYLLRNTLNPNKVVACTITFRQLVNKGERGEPVWLVEISTVEPHKDGTGTIPKEYVHYTDELNLDTAIKEATVNIASQVDWKLDYEDIRPPYVIHYEPNPDYGKAGINSDVIVNIKDVLPAAGIDIDSIEMTVNGIDVTKELEIDGDPYEYSIRWWPKIRIYDYY